MFEYGAGTKDLVTYLRSNQVMKSYHVGIQNQYKKGKRPIENMLVSIRRYYPQGYFEFKPCYV